jgi:AcrR family transcriptional regulator
VAVNLSTAPREAILEAAKTVLRRYGHDKMTVVDIARVLGMSHANVYRFFRTKSEIFDAIIEQWLAKVDAFVEAIARRRLPASVRLEAIVLELHRKRKQKLRQDAEVFETYRRVVEVRPDAAARRREQLVRVFQRLIEEGIREGEFAPVNSRRIAVALKDATALFLHPFLIPTTLHEESESRARQVVRLILAGVGAGDQTPPAQRGARIKRRRSPRLAEARPTRRPV